MENFKVKLYNSIMNLLFVLYGKRLTQKTLAVLNSRIEAVEITNKLLSSDFNSILHINTFGNVGGAAKIANRLQNNLLGKGYDSNMLVNSTVDENLRNVLCLERDKSVKQRLLFFGQAKQGLLDFFHLPSLEIKDLEVFKKSDIIHLHNLHGGYFSYFALPEISRLKPTVWTLHDMQAITGHCAHSLDCEGWSANCGGCPYLSVYPAIDTDTSELLLRTKRHIYEKSQLDIVCPSLWLKHKAETGILKGKNIHLIYNGVDTSIFRRQNKALARQELSLPQDKVILLFSAYGGADNVWKGGQYLEDAFQHFCTNDNILFLNVGGNGQKQRKGWIDIPYIKDEATMARYYSAADLFLYPSLADNCPLVVLESMACGTPVITFNTGGIPELVAHLDTGYVAEYKNVEDFIAGIHLFLGNTELLNRAANESELRVKSMFSLEQMTLNYLNLYSEIHTRFKQHNSVCS